MQRWKGKLAIAWALEQTKYFTLGCDNLLIVTDHKPLTKLFGDKTLDEISNPRLFRLKQRTLLWKFEIEHMPGAENYFSDATSRHPAGNLDTVDDKDEDNIDNMDQSLAAIYKPTIDAIRATTWEMVKAETTTDLVLSKLIVLIQNGFPSRRQELESELQQYWEHKEQLSIIDDVVVLGERVVIPTSLRAEVLRSLHAAHQGTTSMNERAKAAIFWPGITLDIQHTRQCCASCNRSAPSQPKTPPIEPWIPSTPFEAIACDYFQYRGWYYFVAADRLSGWTEQSRIKPGTNNAGSTGLCKALRALFATFGVPTEISSDGGPEFTAKSTENFLERWGVRHRVSSAHFPSSNGRAELAVKATKRLLMDNVGADGSLDTDEMVRALLTRRNTPEPGCKISPLKFYLVANSKISCLRSTRPKEVSFSNLQISKQWRDIWRLKEETMRARYVKTLETLSEHSKSLPPLKAGDHVFVQNQSGNAPGKWDRSGVVIEPKDHDQYLVKIAGTGRLTLRNRRFLRSYTPHFPQGPAWRFEHPASSAHHPGFIKETSPQQPTVPLTSSTTNTSTTSESTTQNINPTCSHPVEESPQHNKLEKSSLSTSPLTRELPPSDEHPTPHSLIPEDSNQQTIRRSSRIRRPRKFYDPESGKDSEQRP